MNASSFYQFLRDFVQYSQSTAKQYTDFCLRNEKLLLSERCFSGLTMDDIVADDGLMGNALSLIPQYYRSKKATHQNALRLYYRYVNGSWYDSWPYKQIRTSHTPPTGSVHFVIPSCLYDTQIEMHDRFPVFYAENVAESEKLPGLIEFILGEYCRVLEFYRPLDRQFDELTYGDRPLLFLRLPRIPVILSKECPTEDYHESDEWIARRIADLVSQGTGTDLKADILKILKQRDHTDRILGTYHHSGCPAFLLENRADGQEIEFRFQDGSVPYIEIYYRNTECPDPEEYMALIGNCLAHEYCHFLHDCYAGAQFMTNSVECEAVTEGVADFCSVAYTLSQSTNYIAFAKRKYESWKEWFGSSWPYANALYFYKINGIFLPFSPQIDPAQFHKLFSVLLESSVSMSDAYQELIV